MKRLIPTIVGALFLMWAHVDAASYLIRLKNGGEFLTNRQWEEGNQILFYQYGGIAGIQKDYVKNIEESALTYKEKTENEQAPLTPVDQKSLQGGEAQGKASQPETKNGDEKKEKVDFDYYKEKKVELIEKLNEARKGYLEALGSKDTDASEKARQELVNSGARIYDLADELKRKNKGVIPDWWEKWGM